MRDLPCRLAAQWFCAACQNLERIRRGSCSGRYLLKVLGLCSGRKSHAGHLLGWTEVWFSALGVQASGMDSAILIDTLECLLSLSGLEGAELCTVFPQSSTCPPQGRECSQPSPVAPPGSSWCRSCTPAVHASVKYRGSFTCSPSSLCSSWVGFLTSF